MRTFVDVLGHFQGDTFNARFDGAIRHSGTDP